MQPLQVQISVISPATLLEPGQENVLDCINDLLNDTYSAHTHPRADGALSDSLPVDCTVNPLFTRKRIASHDQLVGELGKQGLIAICTDTSMTNQTENSRPEQISPKQDYGGTIAVASAKPWPGKRIMLFETANSKQNITTDVTMSDKSGESHLNEQKTVLQTWDWEISTCAVVDSVRYRKQGLLSRCIDALVQRLRIMQTQMRESDDPRADLRIQLWISALVGSQNPAYWARRGFVPDGGPDVAPKGMWGSTRDFEIQTLKKILD